MARDKLEFCPACKGSDLIHVASWCDWETSCNSRLDGEMRLSAARESGVANDAPDLLECTTCKSVSMSPIPTDDQIAQFYSNYHGTEDYKAKANKKVSRAYKRLLSFRFRTGGRCLDVGASIGTAAKAAQKLGYTVTAQEIDPVAVTQGRELYPDIDFIQGFLSDVPTAPHFDLIHCAEVIEHVPNPTEFTAQLYERLRPGGWLFLTTPDVGHSKRTQPLIDWKSVKPPEHITLFTKAGLTQLFTDAGFERPRFRPHTKPGIRMTVRRPK